jgi:hypothetical protein
MGYAVPVLAERAHIADRAQRASVRRSGGEGPSRVLADAVAERLSARNVDPESVEWDAWRREDGRWALVADYRSGESPRHAEFVFDAPGRYVVAEDDEARWLVGEQTAVRGPQPRGAGGPRRLSAVGAEDELPLGEDALELVNRPAGDRATVSRDDASLDREGDAESAGEDEGTQQPHVAPAVQLPPVATGDADWIATQATERPSNPATSSDPATPATPASPARPASPRDLSGPGGPDERREREDVGQQADDTEPVELGSEADDPKPAAQRTPKRTRRASVPSWDEIMFGGGKRE